MNYQPLFDLLSQHGLTLLESEMDEIISCVRKMEDKVYWGSLLHQMQEQPYKSPLEPFYYYNTLSGEIAQCDNPISATVIVATKNTK